MLCAVDSARLLAACRTDAAGAIASLPRRGRVAVGANAGEPRVLVEALAGAAASFEDLEVVQVLSFCSGPLVAPAICTASRCACARVRSSALPTPPSATR